MLNIRIVLEDKDAKQIQAAQDAYPDLKVTHETIYKAGLKALKLKRVKPD